MPFCWDVWKWNKSVYSALRYRRFYFPNLISYGLNESYAKNGLKFWWRKRIITVFVPYAIVQTLCGYWNGFDAISYIKDITLLRPAYGYGWYLNYLLC